MLNNLSVLFAETLSYKLTRQIQVLNTSGRLNLYELLLPIRKLAEKFAIVRSVVRDLITEIEFYRIIRKLTQSCSLITDTAIIALLGVINNLHNVEKTDFHSSSRTSMLLEINATSRTVERRT